VEKVQALVRSDRLLTLRMTASELHFKLSMFHQKFKQELAMRKFCGHFVAKKLTIEKKDNRKDMYLHLLERFPSERNIFKNVMIGDETWIFEYDPKKKTMQGMANICITKSEKASMSKSKIKSMFICFFDSQRDCPYRICDSRTNT
jgi:translation initiation factor 2 alpha subunit (eIF-2alpha)